MNNTQKTILIMELESLLKQEEWFKLVNGRMVSASMGCCVVELTYEKHVVMYTITFDDRKSSIAIRTRMNTIIPQKHMQDYNQIRRMCRRNKIQKVVDVIRDKFEAAMPIILASIEEEKLLKAEKEAAKKKRAAVVEKLGIHDMYNKYNLEYVTYEPNKEHLLTLNVLNDDMLTIQRVTGTFTVDEIKKFLEWMKTCPSVVSKRLLK